MAYQKEGKAMERESQSKRRQKVSQPERRRQLLQIALGMSQSCQYQAITVQMLAKQADCDRTVIYRVLNGGEGHRGTAREALASAIENYALTKGVEDPGAMKVLTQMAAMGDSRAIAITKE
ncbi:hypothetical protein D3C86_1335020 [compost metagenome]